MARFCELTGKGPMKGSIIWRSGKPKKQGGIGTHITAITMPFPELWNWTNPRAEPEVS